jgi:CBS domain-containing protein
VRVQDILRTKSDELFVIQSSATIREAALTMAEKRVGMVLVVDIHGKLAGLLSERDIVQLVAVRGDGMTALPAEAAMAEIDRGTCFCVVRPPPSIGEHRKGSMLAWSDR